MAVTFAPPLTRGDTARGKRECLPVRRRRAEKLVRVTIGADRHRRAAVHTDAIEIVETTDVAAGGREIDPTAVARPAIELIEAVVEGETFKIAGCERQQIDVAVAGAR